MAYIGKGGKGAVIGKGGKGAVAIWNGITDAGRGEFLAWHNREHILERVGIPGFHRGRRYSALEGDPEFFTLYDVADVDVLSGADYLARLAAPTPWTRRVMPAFTDMARALTRVVVSRGLGEGGVLATLRFETHDEAGLAASVEAAAGRVLEAHPEIVGVHLCCADVAASSVETAERKARGGTTDVPRTIILIEGTDPAVVRQVGEAAFPDALLARHGATGCLRGLYRHEISISGQELGRF
ncbi:MAG TPA: hypothetical protein VNT30_07330 [Stellaceae bacterium]|nr:hypothetical protein [Stellaceae bacterium]